MHRSAFLPSHHRYSSLPYALSVQCNTVQLYCQVSAVLMCQESFTCKTRYSSLPDVGYSGRRNVAPSEVNPELPKIMSREQHVSTTASTYQLQVRMNNTHNFIAKCQCVVPSTLITHSLQSQNIIKLHQQQINIQVKSHS